jgi:predicted ribosome quality control (RQC) complex YloA/Tae2 family protein
MTYDGLVTRRVSQELHTLLSTGRVLKIYQPTKTELILNIRANGQTHRLLLSMHPVYARVHLTTEKFTNPKEPPMFCMLLRKHLEGSFIHHITQYENERIIELSIQGKNEIGDDVRKRLIIEIMGKHSNIILVDADKGHILDAMKHLSPYQNRFRTIQPGQPYIYPPAQDKVNPFTLTKDDLQSRIKASSSERPFMTHFMGISPQIEQEINTFGEDLTARIEGFQQLLTTINDGPIDPVIDQSQSAFYLFPLASFTTDLKHFDSVNSLLDYFYRDKAERDLVKQRAGDLIRVLQNERSKTIRKIKKQQQTLKKAENASRYQKMGELLTAHMHLVKQGDQSVEVIDYYDENTPTLTIELNPNKSPSENAQRYFKTYQKLKTSKKILDIEIKKAHEMIDYIDQLIEQIEKARLEDLAEIREELEDEGLIKKKVVKNQQKNKQKKPTPDRYRSSDGTLIFVGKNNKQNEYLTMKLASKQNIWLHTKDIPGSHVVIRSDNPSETTLTEAAILAAYFSKAQQSSAVPVDYTEIKHVHKPSSAKPGYVIYDSQKTLTVTPNKDVVEQLKQNDQATTDE